MAKEHHVTFFNIYPNLWTKKNLISSIFLTPWGLIQLSMQKKLKEKKVQMEINDNPIIVNPEYCSLLKDFQTIALN